MSATTLTPQAAERKSRWQRANEVARTYDLTIGQALTLLSGGTVNGKDLIDWEESDYGAEENERADYCWHRI